MKPSILSFAGFRNFVFLLSFFLIFPAVSMAHLNEMSDVQLKTVYINDFIHPYQKTMIVEAKVYDLTETDKRAEAPGPPLVATVEQYNPKAFIDDMKAQLADINNAEEPAPGVFPWLRNDADKQHLLKQ